MTSKILKTSRSLPLEAQELTYGPEDTPVKTSVRFIYIELGEGLKPW